MADKFDPKPLCSVYDRGRLVPFIGSGMSVPACVDWESFVCNLEKEGGGSPTHPNMGLIQRAFFAMQRLRLQAGSTQTNVAEAIKRAVYSSGDIAVPKQTEALAELFWPLVCTTNYDDIYLRAKELYRSPRVLGRSDADCRQVLQHLSFPTSEVLWVLQGLLQRGDVDSEKSRQQAAHDELLENELVVGHAEYRQVANREPHFRRCFAEVFHRSSLLFLGSGLTEPYFLSLFDEIIELTGPPSRPHFAFIEDGKVNPEIMRQQYHIVCMTYKTGQHQCVTYYLKELTRFVKSSRVRPSAWGFRVCSASRVERKDVGDNFRVVRAGLPDHATLPADEAVVISCGRAGAPKGGEFADGIQRGQPLVNPKVAAGVGLPCPLPNPQWLNDWTVKWEHHDRMYGIVARKPIDPGSCPDRRSPDVIRHAFFKSLKAFEEMEVKVIHVQLLASGKDKYFHSWVPLAQMARAYGQWSHLQNCV